MSSTANADFSGDWDKWLALAAAAASVGLLPKGWQKTLGAVAALAWLLKRL